MEGSEQREGSTERVCLDRSSGSSERARDESHAKPDNESAEKEVPKWTVLFKSPTYTCNADDSGFVELYPPAENEDSDWNVRRESMVQSPSITSAAFCSTPNTCTLQDHTLKCFDVTSSSPIHVIQYHESPLTSRKDLTTQRGIQKTKLNRPKVSFSTDFENAVHSKKEKSCELFQDLYIPEPEKHTDLEAPAAETKAISEFTRGHSTIATLIKSLPLNVVNEENNVTGREKIVDEFSPTETTTSSRFVLSENTYSENLVMSESTSSGKDVMSENNTSGTDFINYTSDTKCVFEREDIPQTAESSKVLNIDEVVELKSEDIHGCSSETLFGKVEYNTEHIYKSDECLYADLYEKNAVQKVDENNNFQLVQKYSDISDACASETETTVYTSSSDEEQSEPREVNKTTGTKPKSSRKSKYPRRSAVKEDPRFKGVTIWLQTSFRNGKSRLQISAFYSNVKAASPGRRSPAYHGRCTLRRFSFSDQEGNSPAYMTNHSHVTVKTCASCKTRRTPLWRDADDGTPLCNACGIRYKKYRLRCSKCWHIPKKEVKTYPNCPSCGGSLRYSFHKKAW